MNKEQFLDIMDNIADDLVENYLGIPSERIYIQKRTPIWKIAVSAAACLAVILGAAVLARNFSGITTSLPSNFGETTSGNVSGTAVGYPKTEDENKEQTFTKDFDGVVLTVTTDKSVYDPGEAIDLTATLENKSDKEIYLYYGSGLLNYPVELKVELSLLKLPIAETESRTANVNIIPVKPGEKYSQNYKYTAYTGFLKNISGDEITYSPDPDKIAAAGVYNGTCKILLCGEPDYPHGEINKCILDFSVTISDHTNNTSETSQKTASEYGDVIIDQQFLDNTEQSRLEVFVFTYSDVDGLRSTFKESVGDPDIYHDAWIKFLGDYFKRFVREIADDYGFDYDELGYKGIFTGDFIGEFDKEVISQLLKDERVSCIYLCSHEEPYDMF